MISIGGIGVLDWLMMVTPPLIDALKPCASFHPTEPPMFVFTPVVIVVACGFDSGLGWMISG